ncbi:hypothetical protein H8356DRAFT_1650367 [Neocallimastix lanati (nom. inval.)]|jgi:hypothetical protein|nr:hypothetical protein H8356DRAFT_1650367 [Neocallimastix sp. JGI-2020a]
MKLFYLLTLLLSVASVVMSAKYMGNSSKPKCGVEAGEDEYPESNFVTLNINNDKLVSRDVSESNFRFVCKDKSAYPTIVNVVSQHYMRYKIVNYKVNGNVYKALKVYNCPSYYGGFLEEHIDLVQIRCAK